MMPERSVGLVEARIGLSLLMALLVALGYVVLQRLGETDTRARGDVRPREVTPLVGTAPPSANRDLDQPQILTAQGGEPTAPREATVHERYGQIGPSADIGPAAEPAEISIGDLRRVGYPFEAGSAR